MTKAEIAQAIARSHNYLANVTVSGDNVILMGEAMKELRLLTQELYKDIGDETTDRASEEDTE